MRGDSLRDFYAKTIALCGLGLLAGAGALVDYWPAAVEMPAVGPAFVQPEVTAAIPPPEVDVAPAVVVTHAVRISTVRRPVSDAAVSDARRLDVTSEPAVALGDVVALSAPPTFALSPVSVQGQEVALSIPDNTPASYTVAEALPAPSGTLNDDADSFFSTAVRKTRTSMVKTGSTLVDAFKTVGGTVSGAVRRVIPG